MSENKNEKMVLNHAGDHHQAKIGFDKETNKITGGMIYNFSNNAGVGLTLDEQGKVSGTLVHSGETHAFQGNVKSDGSFEGSYIDKKLGLELAISGDKAVLENGKIPEAGLAINGTHHKGMLKLGEDGKVSGVLQSKVTRESTFSLEIKDNNIVDGKFIHTGKNHTTEISIDSDGWSAGISGGKGNSKWSINVEQGQSEVKAFAGFKTKF